MKDLTDFPENLDQQEEEAASCSHPYVIHRGAIYIPLPSYDEDDMYSFLKVKSLLIFIVPVYECFNVSKTIHVV